MDTMSFSKEGGIMWQRSAFANRSNALDNLATKRVRPCESCESCDDVQYLKRMLIEKEEDFVRLTNSMGSQVAFLRSKMNEKDSKLAELQCKLKLVKKKPASISGGFASPLPALDSKQFQDQVLKLQDSIISQIKNQMGHKPSRNSSARLVPVKILDVSEPHIQALIGEELFKKASSGPKQLKLVLSNDEVGMVFGDFFIKYLGFGVSIGLTKGLTFVLLKSEKSLKVSGSFS